MSRSRKPILTLKPEFEAYLDQAIADIEAGNTITFETDEEELTWLRSRHALATGSGTVSFRTPEGSASFRALRRGRASDPGQP